jgi:two-component system phosphate regulon sensor histidine kinase PhoR
MSTELDRRVREAEAEGRERAAILDGMAEAVLALDHGLVVRMANPAARVLFGFGPGENPEGLNLLRATESTELEAAALACLEAGGALERELAIYREGERWFQAFVAPLAPADLPFLEADGAGRPAAGAVIVLNDITRLRRLERVRKDFVANVSHELRTPVQLIKGFSEALLEGGTGDQARSERFLGIMHRNAARMESLIGDLLTLARLEQEGKGWLQVEDLDLGVLLEEARAAVAPKAEERGVTIRIDCPEALSARVNGGLFVQAVVNLLDNAVKYSPSPSEVAVSASPLARPPEGASGEGHWYGVTVSDRGPGIPAKDLPRIFERFYRVDKARSRELGGTGLGLAIVRHVALAHGGLVAVESFEGEGSRFTIHLPFDGRSGGTDVEDGGGGV